MDEILNVVKLNSTVTKEDQLSWEDLCKDVRIESDIEALTSKGLVQAVSQMAHQIVQDYWDLAHILEASDDINEHTSDLLEPKLNELKYTISVAAGIHPKTLNDMLDAAVEYYTNEFIQQHRA